MRSWENWGKWVDTLEKDWVSTMGRRKTWFRVLKELREEKMTWGSHLLDAGCGIGVDYPYLTELGYDYYGVDVTPEMIHRAIDRHGEAGAFMVGDLYDLEFKDQSFDVVICHDVLMHLPLVDVPKVVRELWRVTRNILVIRVSYVWIKETEIAFDGDFYNNKFCLEHLLGVISNMTRTWSWDEQPSIQVVRVEDDERSAECFDNRQIFVVRRK